MNMTVGQAACRQ